MSYLDVPRIAFHGRFVANPATGNNNYPQLVPPPVDIARSKINLGGLTPDEFRRWLFCPTEGLRYPRCGWNYFGDNSCWFEDVVVTRVVTGDNPPRPAEANGLLGASVHLEGAVMADLNPAGMTSTQIFADRFSVRASGERDLTGVPSRSFSRWPWANRNRDIKGFEGAAAVFQFAVAPSDLKCRGDSALWDVYRACGISVRFCVYAVKFRMDMGELRRRYLAGEYVQNPGYGWVVGTVGPWSDQELRSATLGRFLVDQSKRCGPALATVDSLRETVHLDLMNTVPETADLEKVDLGDVTLTVRNGDDVAPVGDIATDRSAYELNGGVVDIALGKIPTEQIVQGTLSVRAFGEDLLQERALMMESDDRCVYLTEGDDPRTIALRACRYGGPLEEEAHVLVESSTWAGDAPLAAPATLALGADGATFDVEPLGPGGATLWFQTDETNEADITLGSYVHVRVLPTDAHLDNVSDEALTFDLLLEQVLLYYHLLTPAMSENVLDLTDEDLWADPAFCRRVVDVIGQQSFERSAYMPRTRDLSDGKRRLLARWCETRPTP